MNITFIHKRHGGSYQRFARTGGGKAPRFLAVAALALLAACATPSQRITAKLTEYGVPPRQAQCMGDRLQANLDTGQLRRLGEIGALNRDRMGRMSVNDIAATLNKPGDEALVAEVIRSGISCLI